jgi:Tfp pilus assembly PilM family ATPase
MFALKKSVAAMALEESAIVVIQAKKSGSGWLLKRCAGADLQKAPSGEGPKLTLDMKGFRDSALQAIETSGIKARKIALSIPDIVAKTAVLGFEELPDRTREADKIIKWKAARALYQSPEDLCVDYQVLSKRPEIRVLAVAVTGPSRKHNQYPFPKSFKAFKRPVN